MQRLQWMENHAWLEMIINPSMRILSLGLPDALAAQTMYIAA
jgi:hypothetical protein